KVAVKPGKPFLFATLERGGGKQPLPLFSLPGNPVSALVVFEQFVRPALLKMMGANHLERFKIEGVAAEELCGSRGKEDYLRVSVQIEEGIAKIRSAGNQGSARLLPLANANATLVIPAFKESVKTGERVTAELWEEIL
ncbi:MAG: molybdopterin molybdenumtransferase MoeA, partial [bacterium]|nr:molybdopterin molybdenumtransferase MoeA [bacterium]